MATLTQASSTARGSPARITRPNRGSQHAGPTGAGRACSGPRRAGTRSAARPGPSSCPRPGRNETPAPTSPRRRRTRGRRAGSAGCRGAGPQEAEHAKPGYRPGDDHVDRPRRGRRQHGEQERERYAAPAFQPASNGAPLQMYGSYSGRWPLRISRPARTRSGKFCERSSPGSTECPSSAERRRRGPAAQRGWRRPRRRRAASVRAPASAAHPRPLSGGWMTEPSP